ncbi:MAG: XDD3 family exosortase-dependent surface protein [Coleofasciculaceae cyanobacterium]
MPKKKQPIFAQLSAATAVFGLLLFPAKSTQAATLTALTTGSVIDVFTECLNDGIALEVGTNPLNEQGWQYATDSANDGVNGEQVGGNAYEIYGLAVRETEDSIWVALNGNTPLTGNNSTTAEDGNIGWGDLFFNFSGNDFSSASNQNDLFAVRFAETNDSGVAEVGLYGNVNATSTTSVNSGFNSLDDYNQHVATYGCTGLDCGANLGDLPADTAYFDQTQSFNAIASGEYLTDLEFITPEELGKAGYNLNLFTGAHTIAFKFDKSAVCENGYCQTETKTETVPEPSIVTGLVIFGFTLVGRHLRQFS